MKRVAIAALLALTLAAAGCTHRMAGAVLAGALVGGTIAAVNHVAEASAPRYRHAHRHGRWCDHRRRAPLVQVGLHAPYRTPAPR